MKKFLLLAALALTLCIPAHNAHAFSTESAPVNADNSPKFADPDEQHPGFVLSPSSTTGSLQFGAPDVTAPSMGQNDTGAGAFDQAFAHQQAGTH